MKKILFLSLIFILLASCSGKNETISDNDIPDIPTDDSDTTQVDDTDSAPVDDADSIPEPSDDVDTDPTDDADSTPEPSDDDADSEPADDADSTPEPSDDADTEPTDDADSQPEPSDDDTDSDPTDDADSQPEPSDDDADSEPTDDADSQPEPSDDDADTEPTDDADSQPEPSDNDVDTAPLNGEICAEVGGTWNEEEHKCTKTVECSGKPANSEWSSEHTSYTMEYADGEWTGTIVAKYIDESGSYCGFSCIENYFWNSSECLNPCVGNPCQGLENSTEECIPKSLKVYSCKCEDGYYWWADTKECKHQRHNIGTICTGLDKCFDDQKEIPCPTSPTDDFYGQDAYYASLGFCTPQNLTLKVFPESDEAVPEWTTTSEWTMIDNNTGLEWQYPAGEQTYTWEEAEKYCRNLVYSEHDDWRMPTPLETYTLNNYGKISPSAEGWTSEIYVRDINKALRTKDVSYSISSRSDKYPVVCVRGKELPQANFTVSSKNGDLIVSDYATGLVWQKTYETKKWQDALSYCENSNYAGFSDWRLPNRNELLSLINYDRISPMSDFPDMPFDDNTYFNKTTLFSSSTTNTTVIAAIFSLNYAVGYLYSPKYNKREFYPVRCVRSSKCTKDYFLKGSECMPNPCKTDPCSNIVHSTGICTPSSSENFSCDCENGYLWNGSECLNPCSTVPHSTGVFTPSSTGNYYCGCESGYYWWGKEKGCLPERHSIATICTGQMRCYDNNYQISCSESEEDFFGQDAYYASQGFCVPKNFTIKTVSGKNIVVDNNTGLEWQQTVSPQSYTSVDLAYCENSSYGGYDDWRTPNPLELLTIGDYDMHDNRMWEIYFLNSSSRVWSSMRDFNGSIAVINNLPVHIEWYNYYDREFPLRCVRGENRLRVAEFESSTADNGDVVVTDLVSGLVWQKDPSEEILFWQDALSYCENSNYAGFSDWRLPNMNELYSLLNLSNQTNPTNLPLVPSDFPSDFPQEKLFWSSTSYQDTYYANRAYSLNSTYFTSYLWLVEKTDPGDKRQALCVRNAD